MDLEPRAASPEVLSGMRVLDCSIAMAGPLAAQHLGDLGADVIKVEPLAGEWQRHAAAGGATGRRINVSFLSLNRNKRSVAVNLKSEQGRNLLYDLVETSDVFLQNYRPGVAQKLGVDYETLRRIKPDIVYVSISGYGEDGPYRDRPGQDLLLQAMSGAMLSAGRDGDPPQPAGQYLVDAVTAATALQGTLAALLHRERTGEGQLVTVNMLDAITTLQMQELSVYTVGNVPQRRTSQPHAHVYIRAPYGVFATTDDYIVLAMAELPVLGRVIEEQAFLGMDAEIDGWSSRDEIHERTAEKLARKSSEHWLTQFADAGLWACRVYGYEDLVNDPQIAHNKTLVEYEHPTEGTVRTPGFPYRLSASPARVTRGAPLAGEHTREILREIGVSPEQIEAMLKSGILAADEVEHDAEHQSV